MKAIELLAPAGNLSVAHAAIKSGADALYVGLQQFNARMGAENFSLDELKNLVVFAHEKGVKIYLTLNIDLAQRELQQALRCVQFASDINIDAILIRDVALLKIIPYFPNIDFHFSTQAAISSTAGMRFAKSVGIKRVVLPRELSEKEIELCTKCNDVQTEVFIQGALCFSISGRCFLSSWVGGRSGNRGCCASPCRVTWQTACDQETKCQPFSMHDLSLINHVKALKKIGVSSLKIEGRLKKASWVSEVVSAYKKVIENHLSQVDLFDFGAYTGREQTDGFFTQKFDDLTGISQGRQKNTLTPSILEIETSTELEPTLKIQVSQDEKKAIIFNLQYQQRETSIRIPFREIKKIEKAIPLSMQCDSMLELAQADFNDVKFEITCEDKLLLTPTQFNQLDKQFSTFLRLCKKPPDTTIRYPISEETKVLFQTEKKNISPNCTRLGDPFTCVKIDVQNAIEFAKVFPFCKLKILISNLTTYRALVASLKKENLIVVLPSVIYEDKINDVELLLAQCAHDQVVVEINHFDGLQLAREAKCRYESGYSMGVLNAIAAETLFKLGCERVALSIEADAEQLIDISQVANVPLTLNIYGRVPLFTTRVPAKTCQILKDTRGALLKPYTEGDITLYRDENPYNLTDKKSLNIRVNRIELDLCGAQDPIKEAQQFGVVDSTHVRFNYQRSLK